jgi:hypothetical protein
MRLLDMPTIKDALDIIDKLTVAEQESLKNSAFKSCIWEVFEC